MKIQDAALASMPVEIRILTTAELFNGRREIVITHGDSTYRLRVTRANKLILTK